MTLSRVLVLPDIHVPYQDKKALASLEHYISDHAKTWDKIVYLGDLLDLDCISSHNKGLLKNIEGKRIGKDFAAGRALLDRHEKLAPKAERFLIEGNHEDRISRYIAANPQLEGSIEVPQGLGLSERGITWVPFWSQGSILKIGKAKFIHGRYTNKYHTFKHMEVYGDNVFYGHTHDVQNFTHEYAGHVTPAAQSLGCLCQNLDWMQGSPDKWQRAFAVFHFFPDGYFQYYVTRLFKNRFVSPEGDIYTPDGRVR